MVVVRPMWAVEMDLQRDGRFQVCPPFGLEPADSNNAFNEEHLILQ